MKEMQSDSTFLLLITLITLLLTGCQTEPRSEGSPHTPPPPASGYETTTARLEGTSQIRVSLDQFWSTVPSFRANAATVLLIIKTPDHQVRQERLPVGAGDWTLTLPSGPNRRFSMDVENPHGLLVYQGRAQTHHLISGATTTLQFQLTPIETIVPLATFKQDDPSQPLVILTHDAAGPRQGLRVDMPAHALAQPTTIVVDERYNPAAIPTPRSQVSAIIGLGPIEALLTRPATLTVPYVHTLAASLNILESHLQLSHFSPTHQAWAPLPRQYIDLHAHRLTAEINELGLYAITIGVHPNATAPTVAVPASPPATDARPRFSESESPQKRPGPSLQSNSQPVKTAVWQPPLTLERPDDNSPPRGSALQRQSPIAVDEASIVPRPKPTARSTSRHPAPLQTAINWSNYRLQMQIRPNLPGKVGIIFRHQDEQNYYQFIWDLRDHSAQLMKRHHGRVILLAQQAVPYDPWRSYHLEITAVTQTLQTTIDGQRLFAVTDADVPQGRVALNCEYDQPSCFANVRIDDIAAQVSHLPLTPHRNF